MQYLRSFAILNAAELPALASASLASAGEAFMAPHRTCMVRNLNMVKSLRQNTRSCLESGDANRCDTPSLRQ